MNLGDSNNTAFTLSDHLRMSLAVLVGLARVGPSTVSQPPEHHGCCQRPGANQTTLS